MTASSFEEERAETLAIGCDDFLHKPFKDAKIFDMLHTHLGVRFVYAEQSKAAGHRSQVADQKALTWKALRMLPADWISAVYDAAERADGGAIVNLLEQIRPDHAPLAEAIADLVNEFAFDDLVSLMSLSNTTAEEHTA